MKETKTTVNPCRVKRPCSYCGSRYGKITTPTGTIHPGRIDCFDCGYFMKWVSKSELERARELNLVNRPPLKLIK